MTNMLEYYEKQDINNAQFEEDILDKKLTFEEYASQVYDFETDYNMDDYNIMSLSAWKFNPDCVTVSLYNNKIIDPKEITDVSNFTSYLFRIYIHSRN
jgi:hypothetical protein